MNVYGFRSGRSIKNLDAQTVGEELERIRRERGTLTKEVVLDEAARPDSPLYAGFEWDDSAAAQAYRLTQAGRIIVSIRVLNSPVNRSAPAFVSVRTPDRGRNYVPTVEAMSDEQLRQRVLDEVRQFIESLERRYSHLLDVADVVGKLKSQIA